jgi:outer membrane protein OmpA-like peptidoglycan-associated protein
MSPAPGLFQRTGTWLMACLAFALLLAACAPAPTAYTKEQSLDQAMDQVTESLISQLKHQSIMLNIPGQLTRSSLVIDPVLDSESGQQTGLTKRIEGFVNDRIKSRHAELEVLPFLPNYLARAKYVLTGTVKGIVGEQVGKRSWRITLALTDLSSGKVAAQSMAVARDDNFDLTPVRYYRDSPVLLIDDAIKGYINTTNLAPGQTADKAYVDRIPAAAAINEANESYNGERYREALGKYKAAETTAGGEQLRTHDGIYLSSAKLGMKAESEQAFSKLVAQGIKDNALSVRFLFSPGTTSFWTDPSMVSSYPMWLKQLALTAASANVCMDVIGHTSATGTEATNQKLSLARAGYIAGRLVAEAPALNNRLVSHGKGATENKVGIGTDDSRDAVDRRVEFKIVGCPPKN